MTVTIIGTMALDDLGLPIGEFPQIIGGSATFASLAASIFTKVDLVSIIGPDFPKTGLELLNNRGVDTSFVHVSKTKTFHWSGYYTEDMNQAHTKETNLNCLLEFDPILSQDENKNKFVFLANVDPFLQKKAIKSIKKPELILLDTMNFWIEHKKPELLETLKMVDVLLVNDQEIKLLTGINNIIKAMQKVMELGPKRVIVKKGEHGSIMFNGKTFFALPSFPLFEITDPTGAGDTFAGSFIGYLSQAQNLDEHTFQKALVVACLTSSFTVEGVGIEKIKAITKADLQNRLQAYRKITGIAEEIF